MNDQDLLEAEAELERFEAEADAASNDRDVETLGEIIFALEKFISETPADTLTGAAVKLRYLAHPTHGLREAFADHHQAAVETALTTVERKNAP